MVDKNPYETQNTVDIPDFIEEQDALSAPDLSIFKMSDEDLYDEEEDNEPDYEEPKPRKKKRKVNVTALLCVIIIVILMITTCVSLLYGIRQHSNYVKLQETTTKNEATYKETIKQLNNTIAAKDAEIEEMKKVPVIEEKTKFDVPYVVVTEDGVYLRDAVNGNEVGYMYPGDVAYTTGETTKDSSGKTWVLCEEGYFCISTSDLTLAEKY